MNQEIKDKALAKMLEEMNEKHSSAIDKIHNWLCDQDDDVLFEGILKEDRSINGSLMYAASLAQNQRYGNCAVIDETQVYEWAIEYFKSDKVPEVANVKANITTQEYVAQTKQKPIEKKKEDKTTKQHQQPQVEGQLSMFDL